MTLTQARDPLLPLPLPPLSSALRFPTEDGLLDVDRDRVTGPGTLNTSGVLLRPRLGPGGAGGDIGLDGRWAGAAGVLVEAPSSSLSSFGPKYSQASHTLPYES